MPVKVLIVDDSALVRQALEKELSKDPEIQIVGTAPDPYVARDKIVSLKPDVLTLDIEMPRMDGISFLKKIMHYHPIPVVILSSLAASGSQTAMDAIEAGAVEVVCKPGSAYSIGEMSIELCEKIKSAASANMSLLRARTQSSDQSTQRIKALSKTTNKVLVIGASTGGVQAIEAVLSKFPPNAPGTVIVQHMPAGFTKSFSERLNGLCSVEVREAQNGDSVTPGRVLIAPGNFHMLLKRTGAQYYVEVKEGPLVNRHRPSVDVLFQSAATAAGANAVGVMLTGMGDDGARGMLKLREAGGSCAAQDEKTSIVYGMPRAAFECGAAEVLLPLEKIANYLIDKSST